MLSTCNRTEVYAVAERFHGAYADIRDFLCELGSLRADELHPHLYSQHDDAAAQHLFEVAAGLDSAVLGESEILGQVRTAWQRRQGRERRALDARPAVPSRPARRQAGPHRDRRSGAARRRSATPRWRWSPIASARSTGRHVLVVGAGEMGVGVADRAAQGRRRRDHGVQPHAAARQPPRRRASAAVGPIGARPRSATRRHWPRRRRGGLHGVGRERRHARRRRRQPPRPARPCCIVDIAVPRSVDRSRRRCSTASRCSTSTTCATGPTAASPCVGRGRPRPRASSPRRSSSSPSRSTARQAAPLVAQLHERAEAVRAGEVARYAGRLAELDDDEREAVEALTRRRSSRSSCTARPCASATTPARPRASATRPP